MHMSTFCSRELLLRLCRPVRLPGGPTAGLLLLSCGTEHGSHTLTAWAAFLLLPLTYQLLLTSTASVSLQACLTPSWTHNRTFPAGSGTTRHGIHFTILTAKVFQLLHFCS